ncbi:unnamed protein product [Sphagnum jensenii]|uniref:Uncharacterized protein n=1 Tax=Sphagnum jensenii TaxID=128206 RepID=A0ABP0VSZ5_9BRYO
MFKSQGKLADLFQDFVARSNYLSSANWYRYEITCSKTFFDFHRIGKKKTLLKELEAEGGPISGQVDLSQYIIRFYANLYTFEMHAPGTSEAQERCWESVPIQVTEAMNVNMTKDLTLKEIVEVITSLPRLQRQGARA